MERRPILYVTFDGLLQPLGFSQVVRVVVELARRGESYVVLSVERRSDLERRDAVDRVRSVLAAAGVDWEWVTTDSANLSARRSGSAMMRMTEAVVRTVRRRRVRMLHARSYLAASIAYGVRSFLGVPYLFDARGCWIDERSAPGDWFSKAGAYGAGKLVERKLLQRASAVVTLTALHSVDIEAALGASAPILEVIPTCADYDAFALLETRPSKPATSRIVPDSVRRTLGDKNVLALVGSVNRSYRTEESVRVAKLAAQASKDVHLLVLSRQADEFRDLLERNGFPPDRFTLSSCGQDEMPEWLQWIDWGILLLDDTAAKRGSVPTKLGEFFASGVRTLGYGCNAEMTSWIRRAGSGYVLDALDDASLADAATVLARNRIDLPVLRRAREATEVHFGLRSGVDRYVRVLRRVLERES